MVRGDPDTRVADRLAKLHADPAVVEAIVVEQSLASAADTLLANVVLPPEAAPLDLPLFPTTAPY